MAEYTTGRPTKYDPLYHPVKAEELASKGCTNTEIAIGLGIATSTVAEWRNKYIEFSDAVKRGKDSADDLVEKSLFKRATGVLVTETKTVDDGHSKRIETTEKFVADTTAMIFWLKNRRSAEWRDRVQNEISGPDGAPLTLNLIRTDFKQKSDE